MATKVAAARMAAWSQIPTIITEPDNDILAAIGGADIGTWIEPHDSSLSARRLWIAFGQPSSGFITVDEGAARAICERGKSLLPVGIVGVDGKFANGAAVEVLDPGGRLIGKGLVRLSSDRIGEVMGRRSDTNGGDVAIHRDDLVVLA